MLKLADGREVSFDLAALTLREYRELSDPKTVRAREDELLAKASALTEDEILDLPMLDYKRLWRAFFKAYRSPLESDEKN